MEEGPYVLEILVAIIIMTCQLRFTKNETERGGKKQYINSDTEKNQNGGWGDGEPVER